VDWRAIAFWKGIEIDLIPSAKDRCAMLSNWPADDQDIAISD
jgi:hypothetical protein